MTENDWDKFRENNINLYLSITEALANADHEAIEALPEGSPTKEVYKSMLKIAEFADPANVEDLINEFERLAKGEGG